MISEESPAARKQPSSGSSELSAIAAAALSTLRAGKERQKLEAGQRSILGAKQQTNQSPSQRATPNTAEPIDFERSGELTLSPIPQLNSQQREHARRLEINDVVHSFCFVCRNPTEDWPGILKIPSLDGSSFPYGRQYYVPKTNRARWSDLQLFLDYHRRWEHLWASTELAVKYKQLIDTLYSHINEWMDEEREYARDLMNRFYTQCNDWNCQCQQRTLTW